jgi:dihydroorotate dehydrogenase
MNPDVSAQLGAIRLKNPLICASSEFTMTEQGIRAALDAGASAVVAKSVNESPQAARQLDTAEYVLLDEGWNLVPWNSGHTRNASLFCRSGMAQTLLPEWIDMLAKLDAYARTQDAYVVGSITVAGADAAADIAAQMDGAGLRWIELNLSAPHGREAGSNVIRQVVESSVAAEYVRGVRARVRGTLAVKLSSQADLLATAKAVVEAGADIVVLTGRSLAFMPDIETLRPVLGSWGAIGGGWALPASLYWISKCWRDLPHDVPIIGTNGIRNSDDVVRCLLSGARAVEIASLVLTEGPSVFTELEKQLRRYCARKQFASLSDLVGRAADQALAYADLPSIKRQAYPWAKHLRRTGDS